MGQSNKELIIQLYELDIRLKELNDLKERKRDIIAQLLDIYGDGAEIDIEIETGIYLYINLKRYQRMILDRKKLERDLGDISRYLKKQISNRAQVELKRKSRVKAG